MKDKKRHFWALGERDGSRLQQPLNQFDSRRECLEYIDNHLWCLGCIPIKVTLTGKKIEKGWL